MFDFKKLIIKYLKDIIRRLEDDDCEITDTEAMDILKIINHRPMSKAKACEYLNMSRSKFDELVRSNVLPKGRKRVGFRELVWFEDELEALTLKKR
jgi:predicted DNA-binding transcriptional regulator AlpA